MNNLQRAVFKMDAIHLASLIPEPKHIISLMPNENAKIYILKYCFMAVVADYDAITAPIKERIVEICNLPLKPTENKALIYIGSLINVLSEIINTGRYDEVDIKYKKALIFATYLKIILTLKRSKSAETLAKCLKDMDYALLVGGPVDTTSDALIALCKSNATYTAPTIPKLNPNTFQRIKDIPILQQPSLQQFQTDYFTPKRPCQLLNCIDHWPANIKWRSLEYLIGTAGDRTVPVEIGAQYVDPNWSQELVTFESFLKRQLGDNACTTRVEYLAQHSLFEQIPALRDDICIPEYCCLSDDCVEDDVDVKAWIGPCGTISTMHQDPKNNLLCQVVGAKKVILAAPEEVTNLYPYEGKMLQNTSQVDAENLDFERFPLVSNVKFFEVTLLEGDALFIPPKWWHYVRSLSRSMSVSFWW